jgi:hypothetical protein
VIDQQEKQSLDKVIDRVRKLLALGTSPNENEAALAVAKAKELLEKYDLTMESVENLKADPRTSIGKSGGVMKTTAGKPDGWKAELFQAVADTSDCYTATDYTWEKTSRQNREVRHYKLIGFKHDVELATYALNYLIQAIEGEAQRYADKMWAEIRQVEREFGITHQQAESRYTQLTGRHPLKAKLYFIRGAAETVIGSLHLQYRQRHSPTSGTPGTALALRKKESVRDFIYMEQYGMTYEEWCRKSDERMAKWKAENPSTAVARPETDKERAARERREAAAEKRYWNEVNKKHRATDHTAVRAGREAGANISVRPGINPGTTARGEVK